MGNRFVLNELSYHGYGALEGIKDVVKDRGFKKLVVFTDEFLKTSANAGKVTDKLDEIGVEYTFFTDIQANPTITNVLDGLRVLKDTKAEAVIKIGGRVCYGLC